MNSALKTRLTRESVFFLLAGLLSLYIVMLVDDMNAVCKLCRIKDLHQGTAHKPFQYRMLVPLLLQLLSGWTGIRAVSLLFALNTGFLYIYILLYRYFLSFFFENRRITGYLALCIFYILIFHNLLVRELPLRYPWDMSSMLFFLLGIIAVYRRHWVLYYAVFIIGTFNKETTCFLPILYFYAYWGRDTWRNLLLHPAVSLLLWLGIKYALYQLYLDSGTESIWFHEKLRANLIYQSHPLCLFRIASLFGFLWLPLLIYFKRIPDVFIRRSLFVVVIYVIGMLYVGNIYELRIFNEMIPLILTAFLLIVRETTSRQQPKQELTD